MIVTNQYNQCESSPQCPQDGQELHLVVLRPKNRHFQKSPKYEQFPPVYWCRWQWFSLTWYTWFWLIPTSLLMSSTSAKSSASPLKIAVGAVTWKKFWTTLNFLWIRFTLIWQQAAPLSNHSWSATPVHSGPCCQSQSHMTQTSLSSILPINAFSRLKICH